jgi:hypothetical protein
MAQRTYKLFISHSWDYDEEYERIVRLLNGVRSFAWENLSVPIGNPIHVRGEDDLPYELRNRMRQCCAFIACAGMWVAHSEWIQFEINFARRIGRPIVMVPPWGQERLPLALAPHADACASRSDTLVAAIRQVALPEGC